MDLTFLDGQNFSEIDAPAVSEPASVTLWLNADGLSDYAGSVSTGATPTNIGTWQTGAAGAGYEVRITVTGEAPISGSTTGSWVGFRV